MELFWIKLYIFIIKYRSPSLKIDSDNINDDNPDIIKDDEEDQISAWDEMLLGQKDFVIIPEKETKIKNCQDCYSKHFEQGQF